ncbi:lysophospholipid acyltransferase family protein [Aureliella helgolandensis]|uniref:DUF374 domain-containing protein n=1 Tax=Aureliella helgolandensis TaxID=2527968 RepID=A0A518GEG5_9BACT|nr:lysophospholipid acyltransferase family protein [Aureliella helgolandensis]QDV26992.1 hypothetical protein Q31a_53720 [Aureliella helgolandensis]
MAKLSLRTRQFLRRQKPPAVFWRLSGFLMIKFLNTWMSTLSYRMVRYEREADPADELFTGPVIFVFWHEYIPFPIYTRPHCRLAMLLSQHQDAEILSHVAHFAGLEAVRGSTSRGGTAALRELIDRGSGMSLAITPDGPRGPRRQLAQGAVYLSSRLQIPIVAIGIGYDRPWRNHSSWDKFAIPRPFSRCRAVLGPRMQIAADLDRTQIESERVRIESQLNQLTTLAEDWADSKIEMQGSEKLFRSPPRSDKTSRIQQPNQPTTAGHPSLHGTPPTASGLPSLRTAS